MKNNFKDISLTEPDFSQRNLNNNLRNVDLNKIKVKHRILGSNKWNTSFNSKESHKVEVNKFSLTQRNYKEAEKNRNIQACTHPHGTEGRLMPFFSEEEADF